jgi:transposase
METQPLVLQHERIDDIPLLFGMMRRMNIAEVLDKHMPRHHLQKGLSNGNLALGWIAYILSQSDHRKYAVQEWANGLTHTLESLYGCPLRPHEFSDDRLGIFLSNLAEIEWVDAEASLFHCSIDVFQLPTTCIHLDTTTSCGYHTIKPEGIMQLGHSKDHRPDLPQLKIMAAVTQPFAFPLSTAIVPGNQADDGLYRPTIKNVQDLLECKGLLFCADCKFSSIQNRGSLANDGDFYLAPLPMTGQTAKQMDSWIDTALQKARSSSQTDGLTSVWRQQSEGELELIARGYEFSRELCTMVGKKEVKWTERVQVVQPVSLHESQKALLEKKLQKAEEKLRDLTLSGKGRGVWADEEELQQAAAAILVDKGVEELLEVHYEKEVTRTKRYGKPGRPRQADKATIEVEVRYHISKVSRNQEKIEQRQERMGWRAMGTNAPKERLSLDSSVHTYREGAGTERTFHQMKDAPLGIKPLFVKRDDQIKGLTRLLLIALRVLSLVEIVVRAGLKEKQEELEGMHEGQKNKKESRPTAKRLLGAIARLRITVFQCEYEGEQTWQILPLPKLLLRILDMLGLSPSLYLDLARPIVRPPPPFDDVLVPLLVGQLILL